MSNPRFYIATRKGEKSLSLIEPPHKTLEEARSTRDGNAAMLGTTAIYKITYGKKPEFIEGAHLFPEKMQ